MSTIADALVRVPLLAGCDPSSARRLGGLTNRNFLVDHRGGQYVVRLPGVGTEAYIDRCREATTANVASELGINVEVLHFDATDGLMVTRYHDDAVTMSAACLRQDRQTVRVARLLRQLHTAPVRFAADFGLFAMIDGYRTLLEARRAPVPTGWDAVHDRVDEVRATIEARPVPLVACHCDLVPENVLDAGDRMYLIDYEYSGNNDPMWDLGDLSVEAGFDDEHDASLLHAYFDGPAPAVDHARMVMYKAMCDVLWSLWGVIQVIDENPVDDFAAYAQMRFDRGRELMASAAFARHLDALR